MNLRQEQEDNEQISNRTIRTIQENRAKSTTLSYAKVQREFKAYCNNRDFDIDGRYTVTENKLLGFLQDYVEKKKRKMDRH